jgi:hypothetical protein
MGEPYGKLSGPSVGAPSQIADDRGILLVCGFDRKGATQMSYLKLSKLALVAVLIASWTAGPAGLAGTGAAASAHAIVAHAQAGHRGAPRSGIPQAALPCGELQNVQGPATWWNESQSPTQWEELTGYYTVSQTNGGTFYAPCSSQILVTCTPSPTCPGYLGNEHSQIEATKAYNRCKHCYAIAQSAQAEVGIFSMKPKGKPTQVATLNTGGYLPMGLAVTKDGTLFVSTIPAGPSGSPVILAYARGATVPTATYTDPAAGQNAIAIAVDGKDNVFLSFPTVEGSQTGLQIDELHKGSSNPIQFALSFSGQPGGITVTEKGNVIVACTAAPVGEILTLSPQGSLLDAFGVAGSPGSISLGKADKTLTVVDSTNDVISTYAYPAGGTPLVSLPFTDQYGDKFIPTSVAPALNS